MVAAVDRRAHRALRPGRDASVAARRRGRGPRARAPAAKAAARCARAPRWSTRRASRAAAASWGSAPARRPRRSPSAPCLQRGRPRSGSELAVSFALADAAHRAAQGGLGSGADVAAAVYGGFIRYRRMPEQRPRRHPRAARRCRPATWWCSRRRRAARTVDPSLAVEALRGRDRPATNARSPGHARRRRRASRRVRGRRRAPG